MNGLNEELNKLKVEKVNLNMQISQLKNEETAAKKKVLDGEQVTLVLSLLLYGSKICNVCPVAY